MQKLWVVFFIAFFILTACQSKNDEVRAELNLGKKEWFARNDDKALLHFNKVMELDGKNLEAIVSIGDVHFQRHEYEIAIQYYSNAIALDSNYGLAYKKRGGVYNVLNQRDKKCEDYLKAYELGIENMTNLISNCR